MMSLLIDDGWQDTMLRVSTVLAQIAVRIQHLSPFLYQTHSNIWNFSNAGAAREIILHNDTLLESGPIISSFFWLVKELVLM
jgi:hypothetical protein